MNEFLHRLEAILTGVNLSLLKDVMLCTAPLVGALLSWKTLKNSKQQWVSQNRPVLAVRATEPDNGGETRELVVENCGNRVAQNVRILFDQISLRKAVAGAGVSRDVCAIEEQTIHVLSPGDSRSVSFGETPKEPKPAYVGGITLWKDADSLIYGRIQYVDIDGRAFAERFILVLRSHDTIRDYAWK
jgi:hypothetical protein